MLRNSCNLYTLKKARSQKLVGMNPKFSFAYHLAKKNNDWLLFDDNYDLLTQSGKYFQQVYQGVPRDFKVPYIYLN